MQYNKFGQFVRAKREAIRPKVSLNSFALNNDIEPAILCRVENLKQDVKLNVVSKIANGFGMRVSDLLAEYEEYIASFS